MDKGKIAKAAAGIAATIIIPNIKPIINFAEKCFDKISDSKTEKVMVPSLLSNECPLNVEQAVEMIKKVNLNVVLIEARDRDINVKYRNCFDRQVIYSEPRSNQKVPVGTTVKVKYITKEIIDASMKLYKEQQAIKAHVAEQRSKNIADMKDKVIQKMPKKKQPIGNIIEEELNEQN